MREGPTVIERMSCDGCRFWNHAMIRSGLNPQYEYYCRHPDVAGDSPAAPPEFLRLPYGRKIGTDDLTPRWCPCI